MLLRRLELVAVVMIVAGTLASAGAQGPPLRAGDPALVRAPSSDRLIWEVRSDASLGRVSFDGRYLPFLSNNDERGQLLDGRELFVRDGRSGAIRRLTTSAGDRGATNEAAPGDQWCICTFSRDARQLAYVWWTYAPRGQRGSSWRAELRILRLDRPELEAPRVPFPGDENTWIEPFDWTPDGRWIAAQIFDRPTATARIALVSAETGMLRVLKTLPANRLNGSLATSPDGRYLAAMVREGDSIDSDILLLDTRDGREVMAVARPGVDMLVGWAPSGNGLLFTSQRGGSADLWTIPVVNGRPGIARMLKPGFGHSSELGVTAGGMLFHQLRLPPRDVIRIETIEIGAAAVTLHPISADDRPFASWQVNPTWSHDGDQLAYVINDNGPTLILRRPASGDETRIRLGLSEVTGVAWAPGEHRIAISGNDLNGAAGTFLLDRATGRVGRLPDAQQMLGWSPDGRHIFLGRVDAQHPDSTSVVERDVESGVERVVLRGESGPRGRRVLSVDATTLFVQRPASPGSQSYALMARELASGMERVIASKLPLGELRVSAGGRHVTSSPVDGSGVWVFPVDGTPGRFMRGIRSPAWAHDDAYFLAGARSVVPGRHDLPSLVWVDANDGRVARVDLRSDLVLRDTPSISPDGRHVVEVLTDAIGGFSTTQGRSAKQLWALDLGALLRAPDATPLATIAITEARPRRIQPGFAGYNVALMTAGISYRNPRLVVAAERMQAGWLRYPAGARAGAFDWRSGMSRQEWVDRFKATSFFSQVQDAFDVLGAKGGETIDDADRLARSIGAKGLIVCVNVFTDTPESAGALAAYAKAHGIRVLAWELGNEPTLFPSFFSDARTYATKMRPFAEAIRAADSTASLALSLAIAGIERVGWDSTLAAFRPRYWDMLAYHQYPRVRAGPGDLMAALNEVLATETASYVRDRIGGLFGAMPVIVTEVAPGSGNGMPPGSGMAGTLYGGIWVAEYAMRLSAVSTVMHVGVHQLLGAGGIGLTDDRIDELITASERGTPLDPDGMDYGLYPGAQGAVYSLAAGTLNSADAVYRTAVTGGGTVPLHSPGGTMPALHAQAYRTRSETTVLITNKGEHTVSVELGVGGSRVAAPLHIVTVTGPSPDARNSLSRILVGPTESTASGRVTLPPFSLTRISWPTARGLDTPPRTRREIVRQ